MKILVVVSLEQELSKDVRQTFSDMGIDVVYSGVGKVNAALSTYTAVKWYSPDYIFNYGTAMPVVGKNLTGLIEVSDLIQRDMLPHDVIHRGLTPFSKSTDLAITNGRNKSVCATGDNQHDTSDDWVNDKADVVDMEAWAIAKAANIHGIPWRIYKHVANSIHDITDINAKIGSDAFLQVLLDFVENRE